MVLDWETARSETEWNTKIITHLGLGQWCI